MFFPTDCTFREHAFSITIRAHGDIACRDIQIQATSIMSAFQYRLLVLSVWFPRITIISILPTIPADHFAKYSVTAEFLRTCKQYLLLNIKKYTRIPCRVCFASFFSFYSSASAHTFLRDPMFYKVSHPYLNLSLHDLPALAHHSNVRFSDFSISIPPFVLFDVIRDISFSTDYDSNHRC